jgi:hypothetical protein
MSQSDVVIQLLPVVAGGAVHSVVRLAIHQCKQASGGVAGGGFLNASFSARRLFRYPLVVEASVGIGACRVKVIVR